MVKVLFYSALAQKDVKKDIEKLIPEDTQVRRQSMTWFWCMCLGLGLGLALILSGVLVLYRYYILEEGQVFVCRVKYLEDDFMMQEGAGTMRFQFRQMNESIRVLEEEQVEFIKVPVPEFSDTDPADIVHDFRMRLTAYLDLSLNKCYVIRLNTSIVMPPKDLMEMLVNLKAGTYLPGTHLIHEEMVVTERLEHMEQLGYFIDSLCRGKDTYKLQRRDRVLGMQKRKALNCRKIRHFENKFVVETSICEL